MEKKVKIIAGLLLAVILSAAGAYAAFSDSLNIVNHISVSPFQNMQGREMVR